LLTIIGDLEVRYTGGGNSGTCLAAAEEQICVGGVDNGQGFLLIGKLEEMQEFSIELVNSDGEGLAIIVERTCILIIQAAEEIEFSADVGVKDHKSGSVIQICIKDGVATVASAGHVPLDLQIRGSEL
jgi:hypothetical protein